MTGDLNVRNRASGEIEEKSGLDMIGHRDLPEPDVTADCNHTGNGGNATAAKDDSDGSYVFVNGNDADDHDDNGIDIAVPDHDDHDNGIDVASSVDVNAESQPLDQENVESDIVEIKAGHAVNDAADSTVQDNDTSHSSKSTVQDNDTSQSSALGDAQSEAELANGHLDSHQGEDLSDDHDDKSGLQMDASEQYKPPVLGQGTDLVEESESIPLDAAIEPAVISEFEAQDSVVNPLADKETIDLVEESESTSLATSNETTVQPDIEAEDSAINLSSGKEPNDLVEKSESTPLATPNDTEVISEIEAEGSVINPPAGKEANELVEKFESTPLATPNDTKVISEIEAEDFVINRPAGEETNDLVEKSESTPLATSNDTKVISEIEAEDSVINPPAGEETNDLVEKSESTPLATSNETTVISAAEAGDSVINPPAGQETNDLVEKSESISLATSNETTVTSAIEAEDSVINPPDVKETNDLVEKSEGTPLLTANETTVKSEIEAGDPVINPQAEKEITDDFRTEADVEVLDDSGNESVESHPVDHAEHQVEAENVTVVNDKLYSCVANREVPEKESPEKGATFSNDDLETETKDSGGQVSTSIETANEDGESIENNCSISACSVEKVEPAPSNDVPVAAESDIVSDSVVAEESSLNRTCDDVHVQVTSVNESEQTQEVETSTSSPEGSTVDASDGQNAGSEVGRRPFYYIIRIPRYDDENLKEQIKDAQLQVDAKTKSRDAVQTEVRTKRAICKKFGDDFEAAKFEEKSARDLLQAKRKEIDSLQSLINFKDIDGRIRNLEHMIQHETLALKEEKQFIREIKQLKQLREQLSFDMQDEEQQVVNKKEHVEERLKVLRKEAESLRENVMKAEASTKAAKMKYFDEKQRLKELQDQFDAAADTRQKAYMCLQSSRAKLKEKNKCFWKYKDDSTAAYELAKKGDKEELQRLCINQVEGVMELWNNSDEFRKEYIRCNVKSTLRRLRTLDGRSLGPDEEPPVIPTVIIDRVAKDNTTPSVTIIEKEKEVALLETKKLDNKSVPKDEDKKNENVKTKKPVKHSSPEKDKASVSVKDEIEEERQEEYKPMKEELELARKAEALRKEEEEAALKEQRRLEEKAKAREAMERKKRIAEKAQSRAALRAQKEAEEKEKEKERKARKKDKKKAAVEDSNEGEAAPSSVPPTEMKESEMEKKAVTVVTKRAQKHPQFTKQTKVKSIPPPLRNRGKRKMQIWLWLLLIVLLLSAAFFYYW